MNDQSSRPAEQQTFGRRRLLTGALGVGAVVGGASLLGACGGPTVPGAFQPASGPPKRGGTLRVGAAGGGAKDTIDAHAPTANPDIARVCNLYEPLVNRDANYELELVLAESLEPSADARTWTARLREGVRFHDGRPVTADDVIASFRRITDPKDPKVGASLLAPLGGMRKRDSRTVEFQMKDRCAVFDDYLAQYFNAVVPADYDVKNPVGTGPFKLKSFTAGRQSTFVRNEHYWRDGQPYLDELVVIDFPDDNARVNAILAGQVDAIDQVPLALTEVLRSDPRLAVLNSKPGLWLPFTMRVDTPPFDDERVRQAMRLVVDREQMVEQVLSGQGRVGNDLYAPFDAGYADELPQRKQDIARAKRLLAEAGQQNLEVELVTSPINAGLVEAAQVYAQQAKKAGVRVKVRQVDTGTFFGDNYLKWPFAVDFWATRNFLAQASQGSLPDSPFNETHWSDRRFRELVSEATATMDEKKRNALIAQAQRIEYDRGGYIIWGFPDLVDAHSRYVQGLEPSKIGLAMNSYRFNATWLS